MPYKPLYKNMPPPGIILVDDGYLESAVQIISGYCKKHRNCEGCRFNTDADCYFQDTFVPPCDWVFPQESEDE